MVLFSLRQTPINELGLKRSRPFLAETSNSCVIILVMFPSTLSAI